MAPKQPPLGGLRRGSQFTAYFANHAYSALDQRQVGGKFTLVDIQVIFQADAAIATLGGRLGDDRKFHA